MIADIAVGIFLLAGILAGIRLIRGPSLADRVISLDAALVALMGGIGTRVAETGDTLRSRFKLFVENHNRIDVIKHGNTDFVIQHEG